LNLESGLHRIESIVETTDMFESRLRYREKFNGRPFAAVNKLSATNESGL
jgi:hypothetical protein